jgi:aminopeptidase YwaD
MTHRPMMPLWAVLTALLLPLPASTLAATFEGANAKAIVEEITQDRYQGRKSGLEGGRLTEEYIARRFAEWGLEPGGTGGTYFQDVPMLVTVERGASLELPDDPFGPVSFLYGDDFALITNSGSGDVTAELVIVGHGLASAARAWNDYGNIDVAGKIVLIVRGSPENGYAWENAGSRDSTLNEAVRRGAAAVLFSQGDGAVQGAAIHDGSYHPDIPIVSVSKRVLEHALLDTGYDVERYRSTLKEQPLPLATGRRMRVTADVVRQEGGEARNVIGRVPGADHRLSREIVIVGGHMDHVGMNGAGLVYPGADDNASGTAVVMELARSFAAARTRPARTLVFVLFAGEEQGLLGSTALAERSPFEMNRAVAMLNFDMEGHGGGKAAIGGGEYYPEVWRSFRALLPDSLAAKLVTARAWGGDSSDHAPFRDRGIPVCSVWSDGGHHFYHSIQDDAVWVSADVLGTVGTLARRWIRSLADWSEPLAVENRAGRALLYSSDQVDFDGAVKGPIPPFVRGRVRWFNAWAFGGAAFLDTLANLETRDDRGDSLALASSLAGVRAASRKGLPAALIGLNESPYEQVIDARIRLVSDLKVSMVRWPGAPPTADDAPHLQALADRGITLLVSADAAWRDRIPSGAKAAVRFFPSRGEGVTDPGAFPRKGTLFVLALRGETGPADAARVIQRLGWDRVHLDLSPWIARGGERAIWAFLEALQTRGRFEPSQMRAILGDNLSRL